MEHEEMILRFPDISIVLVVECILEEHKVIFILHSQYPGRWWPDSKGPGVFHYIGELPKWVLMEL